MCFLDKAKQVIKDKQQWASGESVTLWSKGAMQVWVKNESGFLTMQFFIDNKKLTQRYYSKPLTVGYLHPEQGWLFSTDVENNYAMWVNEVKQASAYKEMVAPAAPPATPSNGATGKPAPALMCSAYGVQ